MDRVDGAARAQSLRRRRRRMFLWSVVLIVAGGMLAPFAGLLLVDGGSVLAAAEESNPRANYWRAVRDGLSGYTAVRGPETEVLIQNGGQNWRQVRNGPVANYLPWVLAVSVVAIGLFQIIRGRVRLDQAPSGERIPRWNLFERFLHWYTAILFIVLAITGASLLFGRGVLIPVLGPRAFAAYADVAIHLHNYVGPFFCGGLLLEILLWIRHNIPRGYDFTWFRQGGGLFRRGVHPPAGRMNGGEKAWFWVICTVGVAVCVSGLILAFPEYGQTRETMQIANIVHAVAAIVWIAVALGHIYIGTAGTEGSLEAMTRGDVSAEWARQHHNLWYDEVRRRQAEAPRGGEVKGGASHTATG